MSHKSKLSADVLPAEAKAISPPATEFGVAAASQSVEPARFDGSIVKAASRSALLILT